MRFQLVRFFTLTSLGMFLLMAGALWYFENEQSNFFRHVESEQAGFFNEVQQNFAKEQDASARRDLMLIAEAGNVNLTRLFANALWERDFAPFVAKAQGVSFDQCRAMADETKDGKTVPTKEKKECFSEGGKQIMALPEFRALDAKVYDSMKKSTVFKIKVFDLRGITVYSSEHKQIGEDKSSNAGWKSAAFDGKPKSELTFRDKFSAFEGVVEKRDMFSSYLPVLAPGTDKIVGVFEVYSDVTPFLAQIKETSANIKKAADRNAAKVQQTSEENQAKVEASGTETLAIIMGLLLTLFGALYAIVRRADGVIKSQEKEREHSQQQLAQSEKMASLGQMVAGVAHQLNTPIAFSKSNVEMAVMGLQNFELPVKVANRLNEIISQTDADHVTLNVAQARAMLAEISASEQDVTMMSQMMGDVLNGLEQMRELVDNLREFTRLDRAKTAEYDLNRGLHNVIYIAKSVIPNEIEVVEEMGEVPPVVCHASQLNQVFLNLVNNASQAIEGSGKIFVRTRAEGDQVKIEIEDTGRGIAPDVLPHIFDLYYTTKKAGEGTGLGLAIAKDIVTHHGGRIDVATEVGKGTTMTVTLPIASGTLS